VGQQRGERGVQPAARRVGVLDQTGNRDEAFSVLIQVNQSWLPSCIQLVGLDFLVDADLHPWLLEVNGTPSLQVSGRVGGECVVLPARMMWVG
jgi:hypothetical protein